MTNVLVLIKVSITVFVIVAGVFFLKVSNLTPFFPESEPDPSRQGRAGPAAVAVRHRRRRPRRTASPGC